MINTAFVSSYFKLLGVWITADLTWNLHVEKINSKASKRLYVLRLLRRTGLNQSYLCTVYCSSVRPTLEYACLVRQTSLPNYLADVNETAQKRALVIIFPGLSDAESLTKIGLNSLSTRRDNLWKIFF